MNGVLKVQLCALAMTLGMPAFSHAQSDEERAAEIIQQWRENSRDVSSVRTGVRYWSYDRVFQKVTCGTGEIGWRPPDSFFIKIGPVGDDDLRLKPVVEKGGVSYQASAAEPFQWRFEDGVMRFVRESPKVCVETTRASAEKSWLTKMFVEVMEVLSILPGCPDKFGVSDWKFRFDREDDTHLFLFAERPGAATGAVGLRNLQFCFRKSPLELVATQYKDTTGNRTTVYVFDQPELNPSDWPELDLTGYEVNAN